MFIYIYDGQLNQPDMHMQYAMDNKAADDDWLWQM